MKQLMRLLSGDIMMMVVVVTVYRATDTPAGHPEDGRPDYPLLPALHRDVH